ncbi:tetratricopeptide repeat protein [Nitrosophilus labii]|uniref:tetratricopeptide repeat protein n=1 Tax=Nitrosophilus labii TaxID=2706014 RepID=UPI001656ABE7|nr:tetratricopeptide repeat protein [Nitrosophilus labii]
MENFLLEYRDPLFGILVFLILVFIVSFFSYWWAWYKRKEQDDEIARFFAKFEESADEEILNIEKEKDTKKAFLLLASAFERSGDFEKAIAIYVNLSKSEEKPKERQELLKKLGFIYFKAGFLEKSREIFLESLKFYPRDKEALRFLMVIYERLQQYDKAKEVLESLEELGEGKEEKNYFKALDIVKNMKNDDKTLLEIYKNSSLHVRLIFEYLFKKDPKKAWEKLKSKDYKKLSDLFWNLPKENVDMNVVKKSDFLSQLYSAKGYARLKNESEVFEFDVLLNLNKDIADLDFEYICEECKQVFPFSFSRCPSCLIARSPKVELMLTKKRGNNEESISFQ